MDDREVAKHWDANAPDWVEAVRAGYDVYRLGLNNPAFFAMLPEVKHLRVLDVGCGEGFNTRLLADRGASVVGVDVSREMIAAARAHEASEPRGIEYHLASGSDLRAFADASFDAAVSTMAMMDVADYAGCVGEVARVVAAGGFFQFSVIHPCTFTPRWKWVRDESGRRLGVLVGNYFSLEPIAPHEQVEEWFFGAAPAKVKAAARPFRVPRFFRTLSEYFNTLVEAGFVVDRLCEPYAGEGTPHLEDTRIVPYSLIFRCRKA